jgi:nucleotide-binding universal stress UspA family protein
MSAAEHKTAAAEHEAAATEQETAAAAAPDRPREAPSPKPVVVGYDGSPASSAAVDWAAAAAARRNTTLQVLTAVDYASVPVWPGASTEYLRDVAMDQARSVADEGVSRALSVGAGVQASSVPAAGGAAGALVEASRAASLLVLGRAEHGAFTSALLGARSLTVIAHACCPVMLVPTGPVLPPGPGHPVVVGVDGSPAATSALAFAADVAAGWGAPLTVMSVWQVPSSETWARAYWDAAPQDSGLHNAKRQRAEQVVQEAVNRVRAEHPDVDVTGQAVEGRAGQALAAASADAGVVVVGSRGHGGFTGMLLGSVSHAVLHAARGPVAVIQPRP